jgi:5-formyltetrahydrofolate cyclo-ligase
MEFRNRVPLVVEFEAMEKVLLRQRLLAERAALEPAEVRRASEAVCYHLSNWPVFQQARGVLAYMAFRNEVSLQPLMDAHPEKIWALPRTLAGRHLSVCRYERGRLVTHSFGMEEPASDAPLVPLEAIDLVLVPGAGFDRFGGRVGYGGGCYDRLLPQLAAVRVGVAHTLNPDLAIPCEEHDCRVDWLSLPEGILACERRYEEEV